MNRECKKFEKEFALKQGRKYAVCVNSGSTANLVLIQSLINIGILKKNDRIGVSALTWPTNIMPLMQLGLVPILIDCEITTLNISTKTLRKNIRKIKALFITNALGFCDDLPKIKTLCSHNGVILIEDNCEALGSKIKGTLLGNFGLASTFSFFVGHHLSTIEGGMICTDDEILRDMLIMVRAHGWDRNLETEKQKKLRLLSNTDNFYAKYLFHDLAFNVRPTEITGFLGKIQLKYWDKIVAKRESNYIIFKEALKKNNDFISVENESMDIISSFALPIICRSKKLCEKYKKIFSNFAEIRPLIAGDMTKQPFFKKYYPKKIMKCKNASIIHSNAFYLGNNPELTKRELQKIKHALIGKK
jgi:CDP-6-deoxy-D-xylo-4-hexulose-3-dehydrase